MSKIIRIFTFLNKDYETEYYVKDGEAKPKKVSVDKWFNLYDKSFGDESIKVLPPLTAIELC